MLKDFKNYFCVNARGARTSTRANTGNILRSYFEMWLRVFAPSLYMDIDYIYMCGCNLHWKTATKPWRFLLRFGFLLSHCFVFFSLFLRVSCCFISSWNPKTARQMRLQAYIYIECLSYSRCIHAPQVPIQNCLGILAVSSCLSETPICS